MVAGPDITFEGGTLDVTSELPGSCAVAARLPSRVPREPLWPLPPAKECGYWPLAVGTSGTDSIS